MRSARVRACILGMVAVLAACGDATPTPEPTLPPRPDVPDRWRTITSDEGDLELAVPQETVVTHTTGAILGTVEVGRAVVQVLAAAPAHIEQRTAGQSTLDWLAAGWLPDFNEAGVRGEIGQRQLLLPEGPALEASATYQGTESQAWKIIYVISTTRGDAILELSGVLSGVEQRPEADADQLRLIRELVAFD